MESGTWQKDDPRYLSEQLITYIGNKRSLLPFIAKGLSIVQQKLHKEKLSCLDLFSGSGVVSRFLKQYASELSVNDFELYADTISRCYLADIPDTAEIQYYYNTITAAAARRMQELGEPPYAVPPGFISELYAPHDADRIQAGERCFYTPRNAAHIDVLRQEICAVPPELQPFFIAPLLSEASIHANTAGVFKGFYKNKESHIGQFGGTARDALFRITGGITLPFPLFSRFSCPCRIYRQDANELARELASRADTSFDVVYLDPPYNQHPYGSNYFMLNLIASYDRPDDTKLSRVSGIPRGWNRSAYNKRQKAAETFRQLVTDLNARFLLISFNSEGFIPRDTMLELLSGIGRVTCLTEQYNTFRGSRNLRGRAIHVNEFLYIVEK